MPKKATNIDLEKSCSYHFSSFFQSSFLLFFSLLPVREQHPYLVPPEIPTKWHGNGTKHEYQVMAPVINLQWTGLFQNLVLNLKSLNPHTFPNNYRGKSSREVLILIMIYIWVLISKAPILKCIGIQGYILNNPSSSRNEVKSFLEELRS